MNILLTGSTGFLGRHLLSFFDKHKYPTIALSSKNHNLLYPLRGGILEKTKFDYIFHCAVDTKAGDYCLTHQADQWVTNSLINTHVVNFWRKFHPQAKLVTFGSSCAYPLDQLKVERNYMCGLPDNTLHTYAMTKRMLLEGLRACELQDGLSYYYFILNTLYGPQFSLNDHHFIFDLIQKICAAKYEGIPAVLWGDGLQTRELLYIEDVVLMIMKTVKNKKLENKPLNIARGVEFPLREYASIICDIIQYDFNKIEFDTSAFTGQKSKVLEPNSEIGPCNDTSLFSGIKKTIEYFLSQRYGMSLV